MNVTIFKKIVSVAALTGILAGLLLTAVQQVQVLPLILKAEVYEEAAEAARQPGTPAAVTAPAQEAHEHQAHEHEAWEPENGWERNLFTAGANIIVALGFALLLGAAVTLRGGKLDWRSGLLWGLAGYAVFFVAPSLGLPPELPGTEAAELTHRQAWWIATAIITATGLGLIAFGRQWAIKIAGALVLVVPHLIGAPQPAVHGGVAPAELMNQFIIATAITNAALWLALGGLFGFFHKKFA